VKQKISIVLGGIVVTLVFLLQHLWLKATTKYLRIKEHIEVITAIMIIMAITVIGTTEVVLLVTQAGGVIVDRVAILATAVMA
jgi:hypothetical protein